MLRAPLRVDPNNPHQRQLKIDQERAADPECYDINTKLQNGLINDGEHDDMDDFNKLSSFIKNLELLTGPDSETLAQELTTESNKILNCLARNILKHLQDEGPRGGKSRNRRNKNKRTKRNKY